MSTLLSGKPPPPNRALHFCGVRYFLPALAAVFLFGSVPRRQAVIPKARALFFPLRLFSPSSPKKEGFLSSAQHEMQHGAPQIPCLLSQIAKEKVRRESLPSHLRPVITGRKGIFSGKINCTILRIVSLVPRGPDPAGREFSLYRAFKKTQKILLYFYFPID